MGESPHADTIASHIPAVAVLPGGEYLMGCDRGRADEQPVHGVRVDAFAMGITTVTNEQYRFFVSRTGGRMPDSFLEPQFSHPRQPVVSVSWQQAAAYCNWLSDWTHENYRLPTEAEWEWAVRQKKEGCLYAWGDEDPSEFELYRTGWRDRCPRPVGLQRPNDFGLHDLGENVHEWCLDWYARDYYQRSPQDNPVNQTKTLRRASRGGAWRHQIKVSRCAARSSLDPSFKYTDYGFRVVKVLHGTSWTTPQDECRPR